MLASIITDMVVLLFLLREGLWEPRPWVLTWYKLDVFMGKGFYLTLLLEKSIEEATCLACCLSASSDSRLVFTF